MSNFHRAGDTNLGIIRGYPLVLEQFETADQWVLVLYIDCINLIYKPVSASGDKSEVLKTNSGVNGRQQSD